MAVQLSLLCGRSCVVVSGGDVMELQEFYEFMEQHRASAVDAAVQRYHSLTPLLGKVRGVQLGMRVQRTCCDCQPSHVTAEQCGTRNGA